MAELGFNLSPSDSKTWLLSILCFLVSQIPTALMIMCRPSGASPFLLRFLAAI